MINVIFVNILDLQLVNITQIIIKRLWYIYFNLLFRNCSDTPCFCIGQVIGVDLVHTRLEHRARYFVVGLFGMHNTFSVRCRVQCSLFSLISTLVAMMRCCVLGFCCGRLRRRLCNIFS